MYGDLLTLSELAFKPSVRYNPAPLRKGIVAQQLSSTDNQANKAWSAPSHLSVVPVPTPDVHWQWNIETEVVKWGEGLHTAFGYPRNVVETDTRWWGERVHPEDRERVVNGLKTFVQGTGIFWAEEYRFLMYDGVYTHVSDRGFVFRNREGKPLRMLGAVQDLTSQFITERDLRLALERHEIITEACQLGVWSWNAMTRKLTLNDYTLRHFGLPAGKEITPKDIEAVLGAEDYQRLVAESQRCMETGGRLDLTFRIQSGSNDRWIHAIGRFIHDRQTNDMRFDGITVDSTESNQLKSNFLANMSHEIRTPLGAIIGFAELLKDEKITHKERLGYLRVIQKNGDYLANLINDILDISKIEAGRLLLDFQEINPVSLVEDVLTLLSLRGNDKGISLKMNVNGDIPGNFITDPIKLKQVLFNLIGNAVKFTERGGVTVDLSYKEDRLSILITDTGVGIENSAIPKLFTVFMQSDSSMARRFGGTGLGLALSKKIAEKLGGDVTLRRTELGKGSTFEILVSNANDRLPTKKEVKKPILANVSLDGIHVLLADDAPDNQWLIRLYLEKAGAKVSIASNGIEAVALAKEQMFDLILMDIQMPEMDGFEATREIRKYGYRGPIIALTAHAMSDMKDKSIDVGCSDYLSKPIQKDELIEGIQKALQKH